MPKLSNTAASLLTLLHNVNELIVKSSDRKNAGEVMKALRAYADGKSFTIPQDKFSNFAAVLLDARPYTLTMLIKDIADDVIQHDAKEQSRMIKEKQKSKKRL